MIVDSRLAMKSRKGTARQSKTTTINSPHYLSLMEQEGSFANKYLERSHSSEKDKISYTIADIGI